MAGKSFEDVMRNVRQELPQMFVDATKGNSNCLTYAMVGGKQVSIYVVPGSLSEAVETAIASGSKGPVTEEYRRIVSPEEN